MRKAAWTPSIVPRGDDHDVYLVVDDLGRIGRVWMEADYEATDYETVVTDLLEGQYKNPMGIFAFNTVEGWSRDVSADIAAELAGAATCRRATCRPGYRTSSIDMTRSTALNSCCRCAWCDRDHGMRTLRRLRMGLRGASR
jgi:hypothetical protein